MAPVTRAADATSARQWHETAGSGDRKGVWGLKGALGEAVALAGTLILLFGCPGFAITMWFTMTNLDSSLHNLCAYFYQQGPWGLYYLWPRPSAEAWLTLLVFGSLQALLQLALPGRRHEGPTTPKGNTPVYKANGVKAYFTTLALFVVGWRLGLFSPARIYDLFGEILSALNIFSLLLCFGLFVKGHLAPSSSDCGSSGSLVYDFYWGMELYPRIGSKFDIKTWTNCRMGMMGWGVLILCYAVKQAEASPGGLANSMAVSVTLMHLYIFKFFLWESGYWMTMDIAHDRAGYYLCWGCLNWVPAIYTSPALHLVQHPGQLSSATAAAIFVAGAACVFINYDSDRQRQVFRETSGKAKVWGRAPKIVNASYTTGSGGTKKSLLLASGWWGLSRHFHYLPEIGAAFFWTLPALFAYPLPYFYTLFLTLLLLDRAFRDDARCASKYGKFWQQYCKLVPYKIVPLIF
ncbi:hypothetical protein WJX73_000881 [Symbiochloris irregularis]|uniref:7-dehydrocholesterol reductase n=1 Tax=Symbiochloris irregularis TaxID=706552 RepID=A0AAW1NSS7_9CHLO